MVYFTPPNRIVVDGGSWHVSYNASAAGYSDYGGITTALVVNDHFFVLDGDHREGYKDLKAIEECTEYFLAHLEQTNEHSDNWRLLFQLVPTKEEIPDDKKA